MPILRVTTPSKWETTRINGGVTLDTSWGLTLDEVTVPQAWWLKHVKRWNDFDFIMNELNSAHYFAREVTHRSKTWSYATAGWDVFEYTPTERMVALLNELIAHNNVCEQVLAQTPIPPHWRRYERVGVTVETLLVEAEEFWAANAVGWYEQDLRTWSVLRPKMDPPTMEVWFNKYRRFC